jgi:hypothetical protein
MKAKPAPAGPALRHEGSKVAAWLANHAARIRLANPLSVSFP